MIRQCVASGVRILDFGITGARDASHLDFKVGFGGVPRYIHSHTFGSPLARSLDYGKRALGALVRRLPGAH
jgi:hypothetical protein